MSSTIAKIFKNGQSQAVRLPKEYRFKGKEVYIQKLGDNLVLSEKKTSWDDFFNQPSVFSDDFLSDRDNETPQERDCF
ncbi:MAG: antitoxin [Gammaproteobacteria bacterium]|nr:antitoxin [Gammaproteobacteria bacterium]